MQCDRDAVQTIDASTLLPAALPPTPRQCTHRSAISSHPTKSHPTAVPIGAPRAASGVRRACSSSSNLQRVGGEMVVRMV